VESHTPEKEPKSRISGKDATAIARTALKRRPIQLQALYGAFEVKHLFHGILHFLHRARGFA
jgi:hypothetical protein